MTTITVTIDLNVDGQPAKKETVTLFEEMVIFVISARVQIKHQDFEENIQKARELFIKLDSLPSEEAFFIRTKIPVDIWIDLNKLRKFGWLR